MDFIFCLHHGYQFFMQCNKMGSKLCLFSNLRVTAGRGVVKAFTKFSDFLLLKTCLITDHWFRQQGRAGSRGELRGRGFTRPRGGLGPLCGHRKAICSPDPHLLPPCRPCSDLHFPAPSPAPSPVLCGGESHSGAPAALCQRRPFPGL